MAFLPGWGAPGTTGIPSVSVPSTSGGGGFSTSDWINTGLSVGGSILSAVLGSKAAGAQSDAALKGMLAALALQEKMWQQGRQDTAPFLQTGGAANYRLAHLFGLRPQGAAPATNTPTAPGATGGIEYPEGTFFYKGLPYPAERTAEGWAVPEFMGRFNDGAFVPGRLFDQSELTNTAQMGGDLPRGAQPISQYFPGGDASDFGSLAKNFSLADFAKDPGYDFRRSEGEKSIERSAAARGSLLGGPTLKALARYNSDYASNEFSKAFDRFNINRGFQYNSLAGLSGAGQQGAAQLTAAGSNYANQGSNALTQGNQAIGDARASSYVNTANSINRGISNLQDLLTLKRLGLG